MKRKCIAASYFCYLLLNLVMPLCARADVRFTVDVPVAASSRNKPFKIEILNAGGNVVKEVKVEDINQGDSAKLKAGKIATAINLQAGPAYSATTPQNDILVVITGTDRIRVTADPTKEGFDKLNPKIEYHASLGGFGSPTGEDPFGGSSIVRIGLEGASIGNTYVASINPSLGMTDDDIFSFLANDLDIHGIPTTYDLTSNIMTLDNVIPGDRDFVFGNTDTGLNTFAEVAATISEPPTVALLIGIAVPGLVLLRHRKVKR
jgi:hypothetical protein